MNCTHCGAWTEVAETRQTDGGHTLRRTRRCANGHRFHTFEVLAPIYRRDPPTVRQTVVAAQVRALQWRRDSDMARRVAAGATHAEVAADFGVSRQAVTKAVRRVSPQGRRTSGSPGREAG